MLNFLFIYVGQDWKMTLDILNISNTVQLRLGETHALSTTLAVLPTWPLWQYFVTAILGVILYDQSK
jgi:hypothetical protein